MKQISRYLLATLVAVTSTMSYGAGKIQNQDVKSLAELTSAGATASSLINDTKIYVTGQGINDQLSNAIENGRIGGGGGGGVNLFQTANWDFEAGTTGWTASGGTFAIDSTTQLFGSKSGTFTPSASGQTLATALKTINRGFIGQTCSAELYYQYPSGTSGNYKFQVLDQSSNILAEQSLSVVTGASKAAVVFDCPTTATDQVKAQVISTVTTPGLIRIDNLFVGTGRSTIQVSQSELYGGVYYGAITNCDVTTTSATVAEVANDTDCTARAATGNAQFVNNQFKMRVPKLPKGNYELTTMIPVYSDTSGTSCEVSVTSSAGNMPNQYVAVGFITGLGSNPIGTTVTIPWNQATDVSGNVDFFMTWRRTTGAGTCHMATINAGGVPFSMSLKKFPLASQDALTLDTSAWFFDGNIGGANPSLGTASQASYINFANPGLDLVLNTGSALGKIACNGAAATGLTCSGVDELVGVVVDLPYAGMYEACFDFSHSVSLTGGVSVSLASIFQVVRTADNSITILEEGKSRLESSISNNNPGASVTGIEHPMRVCGTFNVATAGTHAFKTYYEQSVSGSGISGNVVLGDRAGANGQRDIHVTIKPLSQQMPAPLITDVKNKLQGPAMNSKIATAYISQCHSTGSAVSNTTPSGWLASVTNGGGAGACSPQFQSGFWTSAPMCFCTNSFGTGAQACNIQNSVSTTGFNAQVYAAGAAAAGGFFLTCIGI